MSVFSPVKIKEIAASLGFSPSKEMGQNFLIDEAILEKIVEAAEIGSGDEILEVGPGLGPLTAELAAAGRVVAVEKDPRLAKYLRGLFGSEDTVEVLENDFLELNLGTLGFKKGYKVVANLPYSITSAAVRKIMESDPAPAFAVLMLQKEVAERISAKPGNMSLLALSVQYYGTPKLLFKVSKGCFWPSPKVDSAVIKIAMDKKRSGAEAESFFRIARIGFSSPRKQLQNNLSSGLHIPKEKSVGLLNVAKINPKARPEDLGVEDWVRLEAMSRKL